MTHSNSTIPFSQGHDQRRIVIGGKSSQVTNRVVRLNQRAGQLKKRDPITPQDVISTILQKEYIVQN
jgi:hypothetical protein